MSDEAWRARYDPHTKPEPNLNRIRVLFRDRNLALWGIPYGMKPGQEPRHIKDAYEDYTYPKEGWYGPKQVNISDWIYLGHPGWWGSIKNIDEVKACLVTWAKFVPEWPNEWSELPEMEDLCQDPLRGP